MPRQLPQAPTPSAPHLLPFLPCPYPLPLLGLLSSSTPFVSERPRGRSRVRCLADRRRFVPPFPAPGLLPSSWAAHAAIRIVSLFHPRLPERGDSRSDISMAAVPSRWPGRSGICPRSIICKLAFRSGRCMSGNVTRTLPATGGLNLVQPHSPTRCGRFSRARPPTGHRGLFESDTGTRHHWVVGCSMWCWWNQTSGGLDATRLRAGLHDGPEASCPWQCQPAWSVGLI